MLNSCSNQKQLPFRLFVLSCLDDLEIQGTLLDPLVLRGPDSHAFPADLSHRGFRDVPEMQGVIKKYSEPKVLCQLKHSNNADVVR